MNETPRSALSALMMMTFVTGLVDAASVLGRGHVFTANMTGNVVFLGFAIARMGNVSVAASLNALASFLLGAAVGGRFAKTASARAVRMAFVVEVAVLAFATLASAFETPAATQALIALLAIAMGLRNSVVRKLAIPDMTTTVLTLTITGLAADSSLAGGKNPRWQRRVLAVLMLLGGATLGAFGMTYGVVWVVAAATLIEVLAAVGLGRSAEALLPSPVPPSSSGPRLP